MTPHTVSPDALALHRLTLYGILPADPINTPARWLDAGLYEYRPQFHDCGLTDAGYVYIHGQQAFDAMREAARTDNSIPLSAFSNRNADSYRESPVRYERQDWIED